MPDIRFVVYDPPQDGYPFLAVALSPTEVSAVAYDTRQEAEAQCRQGHRGREDQTGRP
jgi:hypothetical protein